MKKVLFFVVIMIVVFVIYGHFNGKDSSTTASGIVKSKEVSPYRIVLEVSESTDINKEVEIEIKDQNLWNLIELERCYFITYSTKEPNIAVLDYIEIRDDYIKNKETNNAAFGDLNSYINYKLLEQALDSN